MSTFMLILVTLILLLSLKSIYIVKESERILIYRFNNFKAFYSAGPIFMIPFIDKMIMINLQKEIPNWYELETSELNRKLFELIKQKYNLIINSLA